MNHSIATVIALFDQHGNEQYGEAITQTEHALQCALLAQRDGHDDELVLASLLHDIGHLLEDTENGAMGNLGKLRHNDEGASFLRSLGFSERVAALVASHVAAKRYLCYAEAGYYGALSDASRRTLAYQGGVMNAEEAVAFEASQWFADKLTLRRYDDMGKVVDLAIPSFASFIPLMERHLNR